MTLTLSMLLTLMLSHLTPRPPGDALLSVLLFHLCPTSTAGHAGVLLLGWDLQAGSLKALRNHCSGGKKWKAAFNHRIMEQLSLAATPAYHLVQPPLLKSRVS